MILTERDRALVVETAKSHALTRDQIIQLGFFDSISRANARLKTLVDGKFLKRLQTPFFTQTIYAPGSLASDVVSGRLAWLLNARSPSPRFLQHALSVTNVRLALMRRGRTVWRFEPELRITATHNGSRFEVRPDGLALTSKTAIAVEVDMGHVAMPKLAQKVAGYNALRSNEALRASWQLTDFNLLFVTTGKQRAEQIRKVCQDAGSLACLVYTFKELQADHIGGWS